MKKAVVMVLVLAVVLALGASPAMCFGGMPIYAGIKGGAFLPNGDSEEGLDEFDTGFNVEAFAGMELMAPLAVEVAGGYYRAKGSEGEIDAVASAIPVTLTAKGNFNIMDQLTVYGGGGLGMYMAKVKVDDVDLDESATKLGFHLVGGAEYRISEALAVLAEVKWFSVKPSFGGDLDQDIKFGGIIVNAGVKF